MRSSLVTIAVLLLLDGVAASAQTLGTVAAEEAARRKAITSPARVIRDGDLRADFPVTTPAELPAWPDDAAADPAARRRLVAPALLASGGVPAIPIMAVSGGEVYLEVGVDAAGGVAAVKPLRDTPPYTESLAAAVRGWAFRPAEDVETPAAGAAIDERTRRPAKSKVLVMGVFRPPALFATTLGTPPVDVGAPAEDVPAPAGSPAMPGYPVNALFDGVVIVELRLGTGGQVAGLKVVRSSPAFDELATAAASTLSFRPPRLHGAEVPAAVYVVYAFRQPITP